MLMPKRTKFRKMMKGRRKGLAWRGSTIAWLKNAALSKAGNVHGIASSTSSVSAHTTSRIAPATKNRTSTFGSPKIHRNRKRIAPIRQNIMVQRSLT